MVDKVLAMLHARLAKTRIGEDTWELEFSLGSLEDGVCSLRVYNIACKLCHLRHKRMMLGIYPRKSGLAARMRGIIPLQEANDAWDFPPHKYDSVGDPFAGKRLVDGMHKIWGCGNMRHYFNLRDITDGSGNTAMGWLPRDPKAIRRPCRDR